MKEHPILFSAPMVRAILTGKKAQTRRIVKPHPERVLEHMEGRIRVPDGWKWRDCYGADDGGGFDEILASNAPYGHVGDRLWVRETWCIASDERDYHINTEPQAWRPRRADGRWAYYAATDEDVVNVNDDNRSPWKPSIHMPRWASRLTLAITKVRAEQLHDINESDAFAEGVDEVPVGDVPRQATFCRRDDFAQLWDIINGKRAPWSSNPWVWAINFEVVR